MAEEAKPHKKREKGEKKHKSSKHGEANSDSVVETGKKAGFSLLADEKRIDPTLSSLFAAKPTPPTKPAKSKRASPTTAAPVELGGEEVSAGTTPRTADGIELASVDDAEQRASANGLPTHIEHETKRKRRRKDDGEEIEDIYMRRLANEEAIEAELAAAQRKIKRRKTADATTGDVELDGNEAEDEEEEEGGSDAGDQSPTVAEDANADTLSPPPTHETKQPTTDAASEELEKANRTVFLGNVSTSAITSKSARKTLTDHLKSFFPKSTPSSTPTTTPTTATKTPPPPTAKLISLRFRSTPYTTPNLPRKALYTQKNLMPTTSKSTNAYAIYSHQSLARQACRLLNGTIVLERHLRVDSVAHPAAVDNRRCIFVGNLGFVDDESAIKAAEDAASDKPDQKRKIRPPGDVEEGLWRTFKKCGNVESVRVIRDEITRVGKGIAYVQFEDANAVEVALGFEGRRFPPLLPRVLRVGRCKAPRKTHLKAAGGAGAGERAGPGTGANAGAADGGYRRKISGEEASRLGRARKVLGRAAARQMVGAERSSTRRHSDGVVNEDARVRKPESFVFEGHRAKIQGGKAGIKFGKKGKGNGRQKPATRSAKRGAAFKSGGKK